MAASPIRTSHVLLMLALILFWGSSFVIVKVALKEGLTPIAIATFRFLVAGALFILSLLYTKANNRSYRLAVDKSDVPTLLVLALTGVTFFFIAQYTGIELAGASIAAILVTLLSPILITIISSQLLKERLMRRQAIGIGIAAIGAFVIITGGTLTFQNEPNFFLGCLILLSTPFLWAAYSLLGKKIMDKYDPFLVVSYVNVLGGLCLIPFSLAEHSITEITTMSLNAWLAILYLSVTCSLIGYFIWFYVIKHIGAAITSTFLFGEPIITVLFAVSFVGERVNAFIIGGGALIFLGVYQVIKK
ncbi:MAG TPA: EamA family transporter [Candidatus Bathyarchaeia archaeon]|nr:EamA family transporter [Candidatus Bathyarchaeia archaeon]